MRHRVSWTPTNSRRNGSCDEAVRPSVPRREFEPEGRAFVVDGPNLDVETNVIAACKDRLAEFKVPRAVYVVDAFPLGTLDKVLKKELREIADGEPPV